MTRKTRSFFLTHVGGSFQPSQPRSGNILTKCGASSFASYTSWEPQALQPPTVENSTLLQPRWAALLSCVFVRLQACRHNNVLTSGAQRRGPSSLTRSQFSKLAQVWNQPDPTLFSPHGSLTWIRLTAGFMSLRSRVAAWEALWIHCREPSSNLSSITHQATSWNQSGELLHDPYVQYVSNDEFEIEVGEGFSCCFF